MVDEIIVVGDNSNDFFMLKVVGLFVSVVNGIDVVKVVVKYVMVVDNNYDVLVEVINKFILQYKFYLENESCYLVFNFYKWYYDN